MFFKMTDVEVAGYYMHKILLNYWLAGDQKTEEIQFVKPCTVLSACILQEEVHRD